MKVRQATHTKHELAALKRTRATIAALRLRTWECQDTLRQPRTRHETSVWALPRSVSYRRWVVGRWSTLERRCQKIISYRSFPNTGDWLTAVRIAQRAYPGTSEWMRSISDREGGWGEGVWYGGRTWAEGGNVHIGNDFLGADTVFGNMQFRYSTFVTYWRAAQADLKRRGFIVPDLGWARPYVVAGVGTGYGPWRSPLGQALTAGYMKFYGREGCHWCI